MWSADKKLFPALATEPPHPETGIIVVVPACGEPDIIKLLDSLASCFQPQCHTEVFIIINAPPGASAEVIENNLLAISNIEAWRKKAGALFFRLYVVDIGQPSYKKWGVGMARKTGMDEAFSRFQSIGKMNGVIVSLDADCTVQQNYFQAIEKELFNHSGRRACSIYFEHPLSGKEYPQELYNAVVRYELHLRYYYQGLLHTGYPWVYHTVGSCMAVKAHAYAQAGGMNRRQAGEDFYFIQKLLPAGGYFSLNSTTVYPSPRISDRVPFGTGAAVKNMVEKGMENFLTYNPHAFKDLRIFFGKVNKSSGSDLNELLKLYNDLPDAVCQFVDPYEWEKKIKEIKQNTSSPASFMKRFFGWFNMFRIIKFLNFGHNKGIYRKLPPGEATKKLFELKGKWDVPQDERELVIYLRNMERNE
ncbi:MAG TPA: hypothetical protein PK496_04815 [Bacteroidales bacterium]|nr:hypothetical protein [Bacteroidales bacterium]